MGGSLSVQLIILFPGVVLILILLYVLKRRQQKLKAEQSHIAENLDKSYAEINELLFIAIRHDLHSVKNALNSFKRIIEFGSLTERDAALYTDHLKSVVLDNTFLLENLFFWGSVQTEAIKPVMIRFDIGLTIGSIIESLQKKTLAKKISVSNHIAGNLLVTGDVVMVDVVLKNILYNAIKYTPIGGNITLTADEIDGKVRISVIDSGIGIAEERVLNFNNSAYLQFERGRRGTEGEDGTGVGLILCKYFLNLMNARVFLTSKLGKGSTFSILFPSEST